MSPEEIRICEDLADKYDQESEEEQRIKIRNEMFSIMINDLFKWVKTELRRRNEYRDRPQLLSWCWDGFHYSLEKFDKSRGIPLVNHFSRYVGFVVQTTLRKEREGCGQVDGLDAAQNVVVSDEGALDFFCDLKAFRCTLDSVHQLVFDDAMGSMHSHTNSKLSRVGTCGLGATGYYVAKKVYQQVIRFLLGVEGKKSDGRGKEISR